MYPSRKSKSMDVQRSATLKEGSLSARDPPRKTESLPKHRRQSSIPKPSVEAPLFRNDTVDRYYSKIPYPTKGNNLFYDVLTGKECWRGSKKREATPRGGLSNLTTYKPPSREGKRQSSSPAGKEATVSVSSPTSNLYSVESRLLSTIDSQSSLETPLSQTSSRRMRLKPRSDSVSSQTSTVLEYGSESTGFSEDWGQSTYFNTSCQSETSSDVFTELPKSPTEAKLVALAPSFLKDCAVPKRERSRKSHLDLTRICSAAEVHAPDGCRDKRASSMTPNSPGSAPCRSSYRTYGRLRRRPQKPVSEASDDEGDTWTEDGSALRASSEKSKKRLLSRAVSFLFSRKTPDPSDLTMEDLGGYDFRSAVASLRSPSSQASIDPYQWVQRHGSDFYTLDEYPPKASNRRNRFSRWLSAAVGISVRALLVISGATLAHVLLDQNQNQNTPTLPSDDSPSEEVSEFDVDVHALSFSSCALVSSGPTACSYPISLLESLSDFDAH